VVKSSIHWTKHEKEYLKENYGKVPLNDIAVTINRSIGAVYVQRKRMGLKSLTKCVGRRKYTRDDDYFEHPNLENSYWAGFIAADGCVSKMSDTYQSLNIGLSIKDKKHLLKFKKSISYNGKLRNYTKNKSVYLTIYSCQITNDLLNNFNITSQKTYTLQPPNLIEENLIKAYIIGYLDGDGSIGWQKIKKGKIFRIKIGGASINMISWVKKMFDIWLPNTSKYSKGANVNTYTNKYGTRISEYSIAGERAINIYNMLNQIKVQKLKRKWSYKF